MLFVVVPSVSGTCIPTCDVVSAGRRGAALVFAPPLTLLGTGDVVTWDSTDGLPHAAASDDGSYCFFEGFTPTEPGRVLFFVESGTLFAVDANAEPRSCDGATRLPSGGFALDYYCPYHPEMIGKLVVQP